MGERLLEPVHAVSYKLRMESRILPVLIVLWPAIIWLLAVAAFLVCKVLEVDTGETFAGLGIYLLYVFLYIPAGLVLLGIARFLAKRS